MADILTCDICNILKNFCVDLWHTLKIRYLNEEFWIDLCPRCQKKLGFETEDHFHSKCKSILTKILKTEVQRIK